MSFDPQVIEQKLALTQDYFGQNILEKSQQISLVLKAIEADREWLNSIILASQIALSGEVDSALPAKTQQLARQFMQFDAVDLLLQSSSEKKSEATRKMFISLAADVRVILLALAQKIVSLRYLKNNPHPDGIRYAHYALEIFSPLANRLGIWQLKWQLEDAALHLIEPASYKKIAHFLDQKRDERKFLIDQLIAAVSTQLAQQQIKARVLGRAKHIYSIWHKQQHKNLALDAITDALALSVIVPDIDACYLSLSLIQAHWPSLQSEYTDYIAKPKSNGYRSLHIVIVLPDQKPVEIQIRTEEMHYLAEYGVAAHWRYKEKNNQKIELDEKTQLLRQLLAWQSETQLKSSPNTSAEEFIYLLTPEARVLELPLGATPIDFAYHLHSDIGHRCKGALVNGMMVPLTRPLQNGEVVEILTHKLPAPSRDWLKDEFTVSRRVKSKIRAWFNAVDKENTLAQGKETLQKILQREGKTAVKFEALAQKLGFENDLALFFSIGKNETSAQTISAVFAPTTASLAPIENLAAPESPRTASQKTTPHHSRNNLVAAGVDGLLHSFAQCCRPVQGEAVMGYLSRTVGISVHRASCSNIQTLQKNHPEKIITLQWKGQANNRFSVVLDIYLNDNQAKVLCEAIKHSGVQLDSYSWHTTLRCLQARCSVSDIKELNQLIAKISAHPLVDSVRRV